MRALWDAKVGPGTVCLVRKYILYRIAKTYDLVLFNVICLCIYNQFQLSGPGIQVYPLHKMVLCAPLLYLSANSLGP